MPSKREINVFNIAFLDLISGALGAVIILYVAVPKEEAEMTNTEEFLSVEKERDELQTEQARMVAEAKKLEEQIKELEEENKKIQEQLEKAKEVVAKVEETTEKEKKQETSQNKEVSKTKNDEKGNGVKAVGFDFKGKNLVFIIDVSGSMLTNDLVGKVSSGLRMFVTSLTEDYKIDVVFFPDGITGSHRPLWRRLKEMNEVNKQDVYTFLNGLVPYGSTPTREAILYALKNYRDATDIILLTDGAPTMYNAPKQENIESLLETIRLTNRKKVQINAIGVGRDFSFGTRTSKLYQFLEKLAEQNDGFFHSF